MVAGMPVGSLRERRDQAIVAMAFLSGFRATALVNLRVRHVELENAQVIHDGRSLKGKNGKNFVVSFFPRTDSLERIVREWIETVVRLGYGEDDALFPDHRHLVHKLGRRRHIEPMRSAGSVTRAFRAASLVADADYSPHCVRDTLAALGNSLCKSARERKAWSQNLGHETDVITERYYGTLKDDQRSDIMTEMRARGDLTDHNKDLLLDLLLNRLDRNSPEYIRARQLQIAVFQSEQDAYKVIEP